MTPRKPSNFDNVVSIAKRKRNAPKASQRIRKPKKMSISKLQKLLWVECKRIIRQKYGNVCYTCGKTGLEGSNWHTGHFVPNASGGAYLRFNLKNLRPQCYNCNINLGGNGVFYYRELVRREGEKYVEEIISDKQKIIKAYDHYSMLLEQYKNL